MLHDAMSIVIYSFTIIVTDFFVYPVNLCSRGIWLVTYDPGASRKRNVREVP